jgi:uncharacterized protein
VIRNAYIPVLIDLDRRRDLFTRYGGRGLPFVVIVDAQDEVRGRFTGHVGPGDLSRVLAERRRQISVTGRELSPADEPIDTVTEFLEMLDQVYDPRTRRLSGSAMFGTLSKRPQPWTLAFLLTQPAWSERMPGLLEQAAQDLWDAEEGGFFFFYDRTSRTVSGPVRPPSGSTRTPPSSGCSPMPTARFGNESFRHIVERNLDYLRTSPLGPGRAAVLQQPVFGQLLLRPTAGGSPEPAAADGGPHHLRGRLGAGDRRTHQGRAGPR